MSISSTEDTRIAPEKDRTGGLEYGMPFVAENAEQYEAIYIALDTSPMVNHRKHYDSLVCEIFLDEVGHEQQAIRCDREAKTIEWTLLVGNFVTKRIREAGGEIK